MNHPTSPHSARGPNWKWWITGLLLLATTINYMDRMALANAAVRVKRELGIDDQHYGNLELAFGWAFAAGSLTFGFLADRCRVYFLYPAVLFCWSLMGVASGATQGYTALLVCRTLLGFFEAGHWPCALKTTYALLHERDRTMGNSVLQSGASIGAIITPQIMKFLVTPQEGSWRLAFVAVGAAGALWVILWIVCLRPRDLSPRLAANALEDTAPDLKTILSDRRFWALALLVMGMQAAWHIPRVWLMMLLQTGRGYAETTALNFSSAYYIATDLGCLLSGAASMWLIRRRAATPHDARRTVYMGACVLTSCSVLLPSLGHGWVFLGTLLIMGAGALALFPCYYSFTQEISPTHVGRITGLLGLWVWAITSPMHSLAGWIADHTKNYDSIFVAAGLAPWLGVLAMKLLWSRDAIEPATVCSPVPRTDETSS
jgi:ACS family hexuronate transporter-like MFS transporter